MKSTVSFLVAVAFMLTAVPAGAQTNDMASMLLRMQVIISEMQALQKEFASLQAGLPAATAGGSSSGSTSGGVAAVLGAATTNLQQEAVLGATNATIEKIQKLLATDSEIYPEGTVSGFFGPKTEAAIRKLQSRFGMNPVGVVGPATSALLMEYFTAYPNGNYPAGALKARPTVTTPSVPTTPATTPTTPTLPTTNVSTPLEAIYLQKDDGEIIIRIVYKDGRAVGTASDSSDEDDIVKAVTKKTGLSSAQVKAVLDTSDLKPARGDDYDEDEAEEMLEDAEAAIEDAEDEIDEADEDGEDVDEAEDLLDEAKDLFDEAEEAFDNDDFDEAYELAEEALELAKEAEDAIGEGDKEEEAEDAIDEAKDAIDDAEAAIEEAEDDGDDVDDAWDLLDEAEDALEEAEEAFDDGDYDDAIDYAKDAKKLARKAENEL